jgi:hypothetical protein
MIWNKEHIDFLREHYSENGVDWCAKQLGVTYGSIATKASDLNLKKKIYSIIKTHPDIAKYWDYELNSDIDIEKQSRGSNKKVWWFCENGHKYKQQINSKIRNNTGCPYCYGRYAIKGENDILTLHPELVLDWNYDKNKLGPENYKGNSGKKVWWKCHKCGHEWRAKPNNRISINKTGCPVCADKIFKIGVNDFATCADKRVLEEWDYDKNIKMPYEYYKYSDEKVWWKCKKYGHSWNASLKQRMRGSNCHHCRESIGERKIEKFLKRHNINYIRQKNFKDCINKRTNRPLLFDFYLPDLNICIEYNGQQHYTVIDNRAYFYSDKIDQEKAFKRSKYRDYLKKKYCKENDIILIVIKYTQYNKIKNILSKKLNITSK